MKTMVFCRLAKASVIEMKAQINSGFLSLNTTNILLDNSLLWGAIIHTIAQPLDSFRCQPSSHL